MRPTRIVLVVLALACIALASVLIARQLRPEPTARDPMATWVCDGCGATEMAPLRNVSRDCPRCAQGQMVQRVFFRCTGCGAVFEGYQVNWSPEAPRAAAACQEADAHKPLAPECEMQPLLVRRPGGTWEWDECQGSEGLRHSLRCPKCGAGHGDGLVRMLVPPGR